MRGAPLRRRWLTRAFIIYLEFSMTTANAPVQLPRSGQCCCRISCRIPAFRARMTLLVHQPLSPSWRQMRIDFNSAQN